MCLPRWVLQCRTKISWHLARSFTAARHDFSVSTTTFPLPAPHPGCFAAGGSKLSRCRLLKLARQRLLHVIVFCLNYVHLGRAPTLEELGRHPSAEQLKCFQFLRSLLVVCGDGREAFPMVPGGRSGPEFVGAHPELGDGYLQHPPRQFKENKQLIDAEKHPELTPYKNLDAGRLKITGNGLWPLADFLQGPLWLPYIEPRCLLHGLDVSTSDLPNFKYESRAQNLDLCKLWDSKGLLRCFRRPLVEGHFLRATSAESSMPTSPLSAIARLAIGGSQMPVRGA
eukprot:s3901_g5.t1